MNVLDREFLSQMIIVIAVCVGGWMMFVEPVMQNTRQLRTEMIEQQANAAPVDEETARRYVERIPLMRERLRAIQASSELARDTAQAYAIVRSLADAHGVSLQSVQPTARHDRNRDSAVEVVRVDIDVAGSYEQVARFFNALCNVEAFIRPVSLSLGPEVRDDRPIVTARFTCELLHFEIPEVLVDILAATSETTNGTES